MNKEIDGIIRAEFEKIAQKKFDALESIDVEKVDFNPFLLRALGLETPKEIAEFMISQRIERSVVTSYGSRIQKVATSLAERGTGVEGADICKEKDGSRYYIQMKSGPNTVNKDISSEISKLLLSAARRNRGSVPLIGMTYGKKDRVSNILQKYSKVDWIIGREFWEFISEDPDCAWKIFKIVGELADSSLGRGESYRKLYKQKVGGLTQQIEKKYGKGKGMWKKLFDDNM